MGTQKLLCHPPRKPCPPNGLVQGYRFDSWHPDEAAMRTLWCGVHWGHAIQPHVIKLNLEPSTTACFVIRSWSGHVKLLNVVIFNLLFSASITLMRINIVAFRRWKKVYSDCWQQVFYFEHQMFFSVGTEIDILRKCSIKLRYPILIRSYGESQTS